MAIQYSFPEGFLWGSGSSAFQVEGECRNHDFYDWALQGKIKDGTNPVDAVHFWKYFRKDIGLMKKMNHSAARIGLEWARIEPEKWAYDDSVLDHYREILKEMKAQGISPMVTLHHFSNPMWLASQGGWTSPKVVKYYVRFVKKAVRYLGDLVDVWITINEPSVYATAAYLFGEFPPGKKSVRKTFRVMKNMADAHVAAYHVIHEIYTQKLWGTPKVGIAKHLRTFDPHNTKNPLDHLSARLAKRYFNDYFFKQINRKSNTLDIFGLNYYSGDLVKFPLNLLGRQNLPKNKLGWDIYPEGLYRILDEYYFRYGCPVYITENGTCDENDELRPSYILDHVYQLHRAMERGVDIAGYYHWSTLDNFELVDGLMSRFGLVHVDHEHPDRKRTLKTSGKMYADIARSNGITEKIVEEYVPEWRP